MSAGLGLVLSECATANLDLNKQFIDVIPESKIDDTEYIASVLNANRKKSIIRRTEIREYAKTFDWAEIISKTYLPLLTGCNSVQ